MTRPLRMVFASHTYAGGTFVVGSHHLVRELSRLGHHVLHLSNPFSLAHLPRAARGVDPGRLDRALRGPVVDEAGVTHYVPLTLLPLTAGRVSMSSTALATAAPGLGRTIRRLGFDRPDLLVLDQPLLHPLTRYLSPARVVFRPTDLFEGSTRVKAVRAHLADADVVVATSRRVAEQAQTIHPEVTTHVLENGVQWDHFQVQVPEDAPRQGCVYVGALDDRFCWRTLSAMALGNPHVPFVLHGPIASGAPRPLPRNVTLAGPLAYGDVPAALARARVGLLPLTSSTANDGRSPMKFYEYLAAGLNVVATHTETLEARGTAGTWLTSPTRAAADVKAALTAPPNYCGREEARRHDWSNRARQLLTLAS